MIRLTTPRGLPVTVPETGAEDPSVHFAAGDTGLRAYYEQNGYVVVSSLLPAADCDRIRALWEAEVKPSPDFLYRQATAKAERHVFNAQNWVMNPILNLQNVDPRRYSRFREFATDRILTARPLADAFRALLGESPTIVQSMYFEGNSATWEHEDSYYLESEKVGSMAAAWIALEDIAPTAGRFFVCPRSHAIEVARHGPANNVAEHHEVYIESVVARIRELGLEIRAPIMKKGDVLFWGARTIHGSLDSRDPAHARSSITCHAISDSHRFLQLQSRIKPLDIADVNGIRVHRAKDLARLRNRAIFWFETRFPRVFHSLKRAAVKAVVRRGVSS